jgi:AcrR family transcriptional regulator
MKNAAARPASPRRPYRMVARAASAASTGERILDATVEIFWEGPTVQLSLHDIASRAGITVQTVIRRFGGKDGVIAAAVERETAKVAATRDPALVTSPVEAIRQLVDHYEALGDRVIQMLAEEVRAPALRQVAESGRRFHREWCERVFEAALAPLTGRTRERRLAQLVAVCDVYTWKLLRRDAGLSRRHTELALLELLEPLLEGSE